MGYFSANASGSIKVEIHQNQEYAYKIKRILLQMHSRGGVGHDRIGNMLIIAAPNAFPLFPARV